MSSIILERAKEILLVTALFLPMEFLISSRMSSIVSVAWSIYYESDEGYSLRLFDTNAIFNMSLFLGLNLLFAFEVVRHFDSKVSKNRVRAWAVLSLVPMMVLTTIPGLFRLGILHAQIPILQVVGLLMVRLAGPTELETPWDGLEPVHDEA
ncbi:MAG: hypothetical protein ACXAEN_19625 [Candidatus Thorarchaeota archaeon]|jgi:hypothetical protein